MPTNDRRRSSHVTRPFDAGTKIKMAGASTVATCDQGDNARDALYQHQAGQQA